MLHHHRSGVTHLQRDLTSILPRLRRFVTSWILTKIFPDIRLFNAPDDDLRDMVTSEEA